MINQKKKKQNKQKKTKRKKKTSAQPAVLGKNNLKPYTGFLKGVKGKVVEEPAPKKVRAKQGEAIADPVGRLEETRKTGYIDQVPASPTTQADTDAVANTKDKNVQTYFGGRDPIDGGIDAIYDVGLGTVKLPTEKELQASLKEEEKGKDAGDPRWRLMGEQDIEAVILNAK